MRNFIFKLELPAEYDDETHFHFAEIDGRTYVFGAHPKQLPIKIDTVTGEWEIIKPVLVEGKGVCIQSSLPPIPSNVVPE
jgi:hypothetical protein